MCADLAAPGRGWKTPRAGAAIGNSFPTALSKADASGGVQPDRAHLRLEHHRLGREPNPQQPRLFCRSTLALARFANVVFQGRKRDAMLHRDSGVGNSAAFGLRYDLRPVCRRLPCHGAHGARLPPALKPSILVRLPLRAHRLDLRPELDAAVGDVIEFDGQALPPSVVRSLLYLAHAGYPTVGSRP